MKKDILGCLFGLTVLLAAFCACEKRATTVASVNVCYANLKQIGGAFDNFALDHEHRFPMQVPKAAGGSAEFTNSVSFAYSHFTPLSNWLSSPSLLKCPNDYRTAARNWTNLGNENVSYLIGLDGNYANGNSILSGDRGLNLSAQSIHQFPTQSIVTWNYTNASHGQFGYLLFGDGSVRSLSSSDLTGLLTRLSILATFFHRDPRFFAVFRRPTTKGLHYIFSTPLS